MSSRYSLRASRASVTDFRQLMARGVLIPPENTGQSDDEHLESDEESIELSDEDIADVIEDDDDDIEEYESESEPQEDKENERVYRWRRGISTLPVNIKFIGNNEPIVVDVKELSEYFREYFIQEVFKHLVEQTNLYSVQKSGKSIKTDEQEMEQFIGQLLFMGFHKLPSYRMY